METLTVAFFPSRAAAEPIKNRLVQAGIDARIVEWPWLQRLWFVPKREAGASVEVPREHFERAEKLLIEWDAAEGTLREAIHCPECGSLRVQYPPFARHSLLTNIMMGAAGLGLVDKEFYCENCHLRGRRRGAGRAATTRTWRHITSSGGVEQTTLSSQQHSRPS